MPRARTKPRPAERPAVSDRLPPAASPGEDRRSWSSNTWRIGDRRGAHENVFPRALRSEQGDLSGAADRSPVRWSRALNVGVALAAIVFVAPLCLFIAIAIRWDSPGRVLYRQVRVGRDLRSLGLSARGRRNSDRGRNPSSYPGADRRIRNAGPGRRREDIGGQPFMIFKFRTMIEDAEGATGPVWASGDDHRVTRVGYWLRRFRLDEIPQFLNVLRGQMSVVGPRPERPLFVRKLRQELAAYTLRQSVRPGITGLAQIHRPPDQSIDDVRIKLDYDLEYVGRRSVLLDFVIMMKTLPAMIRRN